MSFIVDAHLDLAYNALRGREVLRPAAEQAADEDGVPSVGLPDLRRGNVGLACATVFCEPRTWKERGGGYTTPDEAHALGVGQFDWYAKQAAAGHFRLVKSAGDLPAGPAGAAPFPIIILLEGADPIRSPGDVADFCARGMRMTGLAWKRTRYAGGTGEPGPLTAEGVELARALDAAGVIHDVSHLAEESFWHLLEVTDRPVVASHSNCRAIVRTEPANRHLSDDMIRAIAKRGGVIGINFYEKFLVPAEQYRKRRATLEDVLDHAKRICDLAGSAAHVGIGTDMDGGFGREQIPQEIKDAGDLPRVGERLSAAGFSNDDGAAVLGGNWLGFFRRELPGS